MCLGGTCVQNPQVSYHKRNIHCWSFIVKYTFNKELNNKNINIFTILPYSPYYIKLLLRFSDEKLQSLMLRLSRRRLILSIRLSSILMNLKRPLLSK